jgi:hypothetical protein
MRLRALATRVRQAKGVKSDREFDFLLACCRRTVCGTDSGPVTPVPEDFDWQRFARLVDRHRVERLVDAGIRDCRVVVPDVIAEQLARSSMLVAERNGRSAQESFELRRSFDEAGIRLLFFKGVTLSALAYGDPFLKTGWDIDILVDAEAVVKAAETLASLGYRPKLPAIGSDWQSLLKWHHRHKESLWHKGETGLYLDLHTALSDTNSLIPSIGMSSPVQLVPITRDQALPTLTTPDLFAYLAVHGTWSAWFRLKWIADVAALLRRAGREEVGRLYRHAREQGAGRAAAQALLLARRLFALELPKSLSEEASDAVDRKLLEISLRELQQVSAPTERRFGTILLHLIRPALLPGWKPKLAEVNRQLRDAIQHATL